MFNKNPNDGAKLHFSLKKWVDTKKAVFLKQENAFLCAQFFITLKIQFTLEKNLITRFNLVFCQFTPRK